MVGVQSIDTSGLEFMMNGLKNALIGTGGDISTLVQDESRLLALECAKRVGPRNREKKAATIPGEIGRVFMPMPAKGFGKAKRGDGNMVWLNSGPQFLTGIRRERYNPNVQSIRDMYRAYMKVPGLSLGKKYVRIGSHGKQAVNEINRIMVKRGLFNEFAAFVKGLLGIMKASWWVTAKKIDPSLVGPQWIERHVAKNKRAISDMSGLANTDMPTAVFGSSAPGIEKFADEIKFAVKVREKKMEAKLGLILEGYSEDARHGVAIHRHAKKGGNP